MTGAERAGVAEHEACRACGSRDLATDAVEHDGWLGLATCRRCDHRWTRRLVAEPVMPASTPVRPRFGLAHAA